MAGFKIGFNEGSLLRRTLLHVGTFVVGAVAFIGLMSFLLVSIAKGLVAPPRAEASTDDEPEVVASATPGAPIVPGTPKAAAKPPAMNRRKRTPNPGAAAD